MSKVKRFLDSDAFPTALAVAFVAFTALCLAGVAELIRIVQAGA